AVMILLAIGRFRLVEINTVSAILAVVLGITSIALVSISFLFLSDSVFRNVPFIYLVVALLLTPLTIYQTYWNSMMIGLNRLMVMNQLNLVLNIGNTLLMILAVGVLRLGIPGFLAAWVLSTLAGTLGALAL